MEAHGVSIHGDLHGGSWRPPWRLMGPPWSLHGDLHGASMETSMEAHGGLHGVLRWRPPWRLMELHGDLHGGSWSSMELRGGLHGVPDNVGRRRQLVMSTYIYIYIYLCQETLLFGCSHIHSSRCYYVRQTFSLGLHRTIDNPCRFVFGRVSFFFT